MKRLPSSPDHRPWSDFDDATLVAMYPSTPNNTLAGLMGRTAPAISGRAVKLGLKKSAEFMAAIPTRFQQGFVPKNKGLKGWQAGGRSARVARIDQVRDVAALLIDGEPGQPVRVAPALPRQGQAVAAIRSPMVSALSRSAMPLAIALLVVLLLSALLTTPALG